MTLQTEPILTVDEVADVCGVSRQAVHRWLVDEVAPLPSMRIGGGRRVIKPADLAEYAQGRSMMLLGDPHALAKPWPRPDAAHDGGTAA
jgi:excisionase family DNA binding protein